MSKRSGGQHPAQVAVDRILSIPISRESGLGPLPEEHPFSPTKDSVAISPPTTVADLALERVAREIGTNQPKPDETNTG